MTDDRTRLAKLLEMTASPHDAEALTALRMATKLVRELGLTWDQALTPPQKGTQAPPVPDARHALQQARLQGFQEGYLQGLADGQRAPRMRPASWRGTASEMLALGELTSWETKFLLSFVHSRLYAPTERQRAVFERLATKIGMELPG